MTNFENFYQDLLNLAKKYEFKDEHPPVKRLLNANVSEANKLKGGAGVNNENVFNKFYLSTPFKNEALVGLTLMHHLQKETDPIAKNLFCKTCGIKS